MAYIPWQRKRQEAIYTNVWRAATMILPGIIIILLILTDTALTEAGLNHGLVESNPRYQQYNTHGITTSDWMYRALLGTVLAITYWIGFATYEHGNRLLGATLMIIVWVTILGETIVVMMNALQLAATT